MKHLQMMPAEPVSRRQEEPQLVRAAGPLRRKAEGRAVRPVKKSGANLHNLFSYIQIPKEIIGTDSERGVPSQRQ